LFQKKKQQGKLIENPNTCPSHLNSKIYHVSSQKFHVLSCYDEHGTMALYDDNVSLTENITITNFGLDFISTFFQ
jgi:hypothetical protein